MSLRNPQVSYQRPGRRGNFHSGASSDTYCEACLEIERAVLSRPDFVRGSEPFILVKLEFPASNMDLPPDRRAKFIAWRERYGIRVFPTVLLADATGRPYAVTGHIGLEAGQYVRHLGTLRSARAQRDAALSKAANARGVDRARQLDVALSAVQEAFDKSYIRDKLRALGTDAVSKDNEAVPRKR